MGNNRSVISAIGIKTEKTGFFSWSDREIFRLDKDDHTGASDFRRSLILPQGPYQVLEHRDPPSLRNIRKFVLGSNGKVLRYG